MQIPTSRRGTLVWGVLSLMTIASWLMARARGTSEFSPSTSVTVGILAVAAIKSRLIIRHFMEVRAAPRWLRGLTDGWLVLFAASILALYLW